MMFTEEFIARARWFFIYTSGLGWSRELLLRQRFQLSHEEAAELFRLVKGGADAS